MLKILVKTLQGPASNRVNAREKKSDKLVRVVKIRSEHVLFDNFATDRHDMNENWQFLKKL